VSRLHKASTEGRIAAEELEHRVAKALKARTYGDLEETVADLPGPRPRSRRPPARRTTMGWALATVRANPVLILFAIPVMAVAFAMVVAAAMIWMVLAIVVLVLGGGPRRSRGRGLSTRQAWCSPWMYTCRGRGFGPPRRGRAPRSYWA